jgi:hypothetical protein
VIKNRRRKPKKDAGRREHPAKAASTEGTVQPSRLDHRRRSVTQKFDRGPVLLPEPGQVATLRGLKESPLDWERQLFPVLGAKQLVIVELGATARDRAEVLWRRRSHQDSFPFFCEG